MAHDIFISHSSKDKLIADGICANLEAAGLRCWIAPRDIAAGDDWPTAITTAISHCKVMVLIFSASSNSSKDVGREIILAANHELTIIPFKIDNTEPEPGKQYYLARTHWLEAMNPPTKAQIKLLVERVRAIVTPVDTNAFVQPVSVPPSFKEQPTEPSPPVKRGWFRRAYLWIGIPLLLIILAASFWPKFQAMTAPPTASPTVPLTETTLPSPTETALPTLTPTKTAIPTPRATAKPTATTGTVTGLVKWGDDPYEGVNIMLCSNWTGACKGLEYNTTTDAQGKYTISGVEPGKYQVIKFVEEQYGLILPGDAREEVLVTAGKTVVFNTPFECEYDLKVSFSLQSGKVTLHWNTTFPGGLSSLYIGDVYWSGSEVHWISETSYSKTLDAGNYLWYVQTQVGGGGMSCAISRFTIP